MKLASQEKPPTSGKFDGLPRTSIVGTLDAKPENPHAYDDEFDNVELDPKWVHNNVTSASAIDPYETFTSGGHRRQVHTDYRPSHFSVQCEGNTGSFESASTFQFITLPTNMLVWWKVGSNYNSEDTAVDFDGYVNTGLYKDNGSGGISSTDRISFNFGPQSSKKMALEIAVKESDATVYSRQSADIIEQGPPSYFAIHKVGSLFTFYVNYRGIPGMWEMFGQHTYAGDTLGAFLMNTQNPTGAPNPPGCKVASWDFVRFVEDAKFLP